MGNQIRVLRALPENIVSARAPLATAMFKGQIVNLKGSTVAGKASGMDDTIEWLLATGVKGFLLVRDVLNATEIPLNNLLGIWPASGTQAAGTLPDVLSPDLAGNNVSALMVQQYEVEGDSTNGGNMILTQGAVPNISVASAANPLFTSALAHGLVVGQTVTISGMTGAGSTVANATWTVATVPSTTTFTVGAALTTTGTGTGGSALPTQSLSAATPVGSFLTTVSGMLALRTDSVAQEHFGTLRGVLAAQDALNVTATRFLVDVAAA